MDRLLLVFVDALGPTQWKSSDEFQSLLSQHRSLRGVAGFSSGALATILTGASTVEHGRLCLFSARDASAWRSPLDALAWMKWLPRVLHERGVVRRLAAKWLAARENLTGYVALHKVDPEMFRWLDIPERDDLFEADRIGSVQTFLSEARARSVDVYASPWAEPEEQRWKTALATLERRAPRLTFLYSAALDGSLHTHGADSSASKVILDDLTQKIARAQKLLTRDGSTLRTIVMGDHGMSTVSRIVDPRPLLASHGVRHFADSTMIRMWGSPEKLSRLRSAVEQARWPVTYIDQQSLEKWRVQNGTTLWGDAWLLLREGALFAPSHVGGRVLGMHGYGPDAQSSTACVCSDQPIDPAVTELSHVASLVRSAMERW